MNGKNRTARLSAVLLGAALALSACSSHAGQAQAPVTKPTTATTAPQTTPEPTKTAVAGLTATAKPTTKATTRATPNHARSTELSAFFAAAERTDTNLRRAAQLINAGFTKDKLRIDPAAVRALNASTPQDVKKTIPAGMPPELMRSVLLAYSDLASRWYSMRMIPDAGDPQHVVVVPPPGGLWPDNIGIVKEAFANGAPAARRFNGDLAAAKAIAARTPVTKVSSKSRAAAEITIRADRIELANGCCYETGGSVFTQLQPLKWTSGKNGHYWNGTIGGLGFKAKWTGKAWDSGLQAG